MLFHPRPERPTEPNAGILRLEPGAFHPEHYHGFAQVWYILKGEFRIGGSLCTPGAMLYHPDPHFEGEFHTETGGEILIVQYPGRPRASGRSMPALRHDERKAVEPSASISRGEGSHGRQDAPRARVQASRRHGLGDGPLPQRHQVPVPSDAERPTTPNVGFLRYEPGAGFPLHKHDFAQIWYVIEGEFQMGDEELRPGHHRLHGGPALRERDADRDRRHGAVRAVSRARPRRAADLRRPHEPQGAPAAETSTSSTEAGEFLPDRGTSRPASLLGARTGEAVKKTCGELGEVLIR
jgi:mannose-6-phosphate isomerase-like protein (cupin superfamily)